MSFAVSWLDLREPADHAARDPSLLDAAAACLAAAAARAGARPVAVDLGAGTGSTLRAFASRAPAGTLWRLVDRDAGLLAAARARHGDAVEPWEADLDDVAALPLEGAALVTASAFFDLAPAAWVEKLADRLAAADLPLYAALSYDGAMSWQPALPGDAAVTAAFNAHQRGDKGLGPALGPEASTALAAALGARGYRVATAPSPWRLGPAEAALQDALTDGIAAAAGESGVAGAVAWAQARRAASGAGSCTVGHADLFAAPAGPSTQSKTTSPPSP